MPKAYINTKSKDIFYLSRAYKYLIKTILVVYLIMIPFLIKIFIYHNSLNHNDYFLITTFGKLIPIVSEN
ncbi:MAG: hypothetical protein ACR2HS_03640 [Gammaproteobacteria bacterium]